MTQPAAAKASIGETVRWMRAERGWTQKELARRAGLHRRTIQELEADDERVARPITAARLASALGVPISRLLREGE